MRELNSAKQISANRLVKINRLVRNLLVRIEDLMKSTEQISANCYVQQFFFFLRNKFIFLFLKLNNDFTRHFLVRIDIILNKFRTTQKIISIRTNKFRTTQNNTNSH